MSETHINTIDTIIKEQFTHHVDNYGEKTRLIEDLGMDSLDLVELVMAIEDNFDTVISDETAEAWVTVGDIYKTVSGETEDD
tara:strand:+ start:611 stop:856 length:246 start_codon:yes stop_codon:yes gene_type:complete